MTKLRINLLAIASLLIVGSLGAPAAWAGSPAHAQAARHASATLTQLHGRGSPVPPPAHATGPREQDPFADLLLG